MRRRDALAAMATALAAPRLLQARSKPQADFLVSFSGLHPRMRIDVTRSMPLMPGVPQGWDCLLSAHAQVDGVPPHPIKRKGDVLPAQPGATVSLLLDTDKIHAASRSGNRPGARHMWPALWLWRPPTLDRDRYTVRFLNTAPERISSAWPRRADGVFELPTSAFRYRSRFIVGWPVWQIPFARGEAQVALAPGLPDRARLKPWIDAALKGVSALHRQYPSRPQIVLFDEGGDEVGFGTALRGGGPGVSVWVGRDTSTEFAEDWTLVHELLHLGMPHVRSEDCWLSEGITMYHTYVAQALAGTLSIERAWQKLHAGFLRGRSADYGRTLRTESTHLDRNYNYWFVYWAGALWALSLDVWLRGRGKRLSDLLDAWYTRTRGCCTGERKAMDLIAMADAWAGSTTPGKMARTALTRTGFPDLTPLYARLGLTENGALRAGETLARRIMTPG